MTKEHIIKAMTEIIKEQAEEMGLTVENKGTGHEFDNSFWEGILKDHSGIPEIKAYKDGYSITLRSFWGCPELDIRDGHELLVLTYGDYGHKGKYKVVQVRVDGDHYKENINKIYNMIERISGGFV